MTPYFYLVYTSQSQQELPEYEVLELLKQARQTNAELGLTGILLYTGETFFQVLEGEETVVKRLYRKICQDPRHTKIIKIIASPTQERLFRQWSMGYSRITGDAIRDFPGLNNFFSGPECIETLGDGQIKRLLRAFAERLQTVKPQDEG